MLIPLLFVCVALSWLGVRAAIKASRLPPGPRGLPLLGNLFQVPSKLMFLKLDEWKHEFGDIFTFTVAGKRFVALTSAKPAGDIMDRMSGQTSDRPGTVMTTLMAKDMTITLAGYGDRWRRARRISHENFNTNHVEIFHPIQESEALNMVKGLASDPAQSIPLNTYITRFSASATWRALYGGPSLGAAVEERIRRSQIIVRGTLAARVPTAYMVNIFPFLRVLPTWAAKWKRFAEQFFTDTNGYFMDIFRQGSEQKTDTAFVASCAKISEKYEVTDQEIAWAAGTLFSAGVDTTAQSLNWFALAMIANPDVCKKAQEQIDHVVGNRPPTFGDMDHLPYVQAIIKEVLRWRPNVPMGLPHKATEEIVYKDYVFPKGTIFFANIWSICHDPAVFPDHEEFRPERYLDTAGEIKPPAADYHDDMVAFGYGRRVCPGQHFAYHSLFIAMATLLWAFEFRKGVDANGVEVTPSVTNFVDGGGILLSTAPYKYNLVPRRDIASLKVAED